MLYRIMGTTKYTKILVFWLLGLTAVSDLYAQIPSEATILSTQQLRLYPLGWSSEGRWGGLITNGNTAQLIFMDAVTDEMIYESAPMPMPASGTANAMDDFWKKNRSYIIQNMEKYRLEYSTDIDIHPSTFTVETVKYTFLLDPPAPVNVPYKLDLQTSRGGIKTVDRSPSIQPVNSVKILGVILSPYEKRSLAVLIEKSKSSGTWRYRFIGAHLSLGFTYKSQDGKSSSSMVTADLLSAVFNGQIYLVKNRLNNGADPNIKDARGYPALLIAARLKHWQMVVQLLQAGAHPDPVDDMGRRPLHYASFANNKQAVRALLNAGAKPNVRDKAGRTPGELAADSDIRALLR